MKKYIILISIVAAIVVIQLSSCEKNNTVSPISSCSSIPNSTHISYAFDSVPDPYSIQILAENYCTYQSGCHNQGSPNGDYTTYQGLQAKYEDGALYQKVVVERSMPPPFAQMPLDSCQIKEFYLWIKEGAPEY